MKNLLSVLAFSSVLFTNSMANATQEYLQNKFGLSIEAANTWIIARVQEGNIKTVFDICLANGVNNDMLADIVASNYPGITGSAVSSFFTQNGFDGNSLGFNQSCAQVITYALNPDTQICTEFSTPCSVPDGWNTCSAKYSTITNSAGNNLLIDTEQKLMWINNAGDCFAGVVSANTDTCEVLVSGEYSDWRYPTTTELSNLIKGTLADSTVTLEYAVSSCISATASDGWVKTENTTDPGGVYTSQPSNSGLRCVRDHISFTYNNHTYKLITQAMTWKSAKAYAESQGGYLAIINSAEENNAIYNQVISIQSKSPSASDGGGSKYIWLGGSDSATEGVWKWVDDSSLSTYSNWGVGEPDDYQASQDSLAMGLEGWPSGTTLLGSASEWNDINEDNELFFLIEYDK